MPDPVVTQGSSVLCAHGGQASPAAPAPRVRAAGQPVVTTASPMLIAGCAFPPPPAGNGPCISGQWLTGATRVTASGVPLVVSAATSVCTPTGTPMTVAGTQTRVSAT
jgi:hypothetical protein